jgi:hypothetical protein
MSLPSSSIQHKKKQHCRCLLRYNTTREKGDGSKLELHHREEGLEFGRKI